MPTTITPPPAGARSTGAASEFQAACVKQETTRTDVLGANQGDTSPGETFSSGARPVLAQPSMSPAAMMIALTALNSKIAQEGIAFGENALEGLREDIKNAGLKRTEKLQKYFEDMAKISDKESCGLFGSIISFCKKLFTGDVTGAFKVLKDNIPNILKDLATVVTAVALLVGAAAVSAATLGGGSALLVVAAVGAGLMLAGMVVSDPGLQTMFVNFVTDDDEVKQKLTTALAIAGIVLSVAGGVMGAVGATGFASAFAVKAAVATVTALSGLITSGVGVYTGIENYNQGQYQASAIRSGADLDLADAEMVSIRIVLERQQKDLKTLFDSFSNVVRDTMNFVLTQGRNEQRAASV